MRAMLGFKCKQAVMQRSHARGHCRPSGTTAAAAQLICRRRSFQQLGAGANEPHTNRLDLEEAVLQLWNRLANSEDQVHQLASCSKMWMVCSPAYMLTSPTSTSMSSELA